MSCSAVQVKYILGFKIVMGSSTRLQDYLEQYITHMRNLRWQEFVMGVTCIFILVAIKVRLHWAWPWCMHGVHAWGKGVGFMQGGGRGPAQPVAGGTLPWA